MRRSLLFTFGLLLVSAASAAPLMLVTNVDFQPLHAQAARITITLAHLGAPLSEAEVKELDRAPTLPAAQGVALIQTVLDRHALFGLSINPEMRVKVTAGEAQRELDEHGWRVFLVKVANDSGTTAALTASSPNAKRMANSTAAEIPNEWLDLAMFDAAPDRKSVV